MQVHELMTRDVFTAWPTIHLDHVAKLMRDHDCGCVVVVEPGSKIAGILTDRDVCLAALRNDRPLSELRADVTMQTEVHVCSRDDPIERAEQLMGQHQVRRLPVVDEEGKLCGLLSLDDIAREACRERDWIAHPVSAEAVGRTLGEISRKRLELGAAAGKDG